MAIYEVLKDPARMVDMRAGIAYNIDRKVEVLQASVVSTATVFCADRIPPAGFSCMAVLFYRLFCVPATYAARTKPAIEMIRLSKSI